MSEFAQNFKVIIALKTFQDLKIGIIRCAIKINDKVKFTQLPQSEGQFFDINDLSIAQPITIMFDAQSTGLRLGDLNITVPPTIYQQKEVELGDTFTLKYKNDQDVMDSFTGRYFIIILNKGEIKVEKEQQIETLEERAHQQMTQNHQTRTSESPTRQLIQSTGIRTQERTKKDQTKKLLAETKYDPKPTITNKARASQSSLNKTTGSTAKKSKESNKPLQKYNSQKSLDLNRREQNSTPNKPNPDVVEDPNELMRTPPQQIPFKQQSPFQKYRGQSGEHITTQELKAEIHYLKGILEEQAHVISLLEANKTINDHLNNELQVSENKRKDLQNLVREGVDDGIKFREETDKKVNDLVHEVQKLNQKIKNCQDKALEQGKIVDEKAILVKEKDHQIHDLERRLKGSEELKRICGVQQDKLEEQDGKIKDNAKAFQDQIKNLVSSANKLEAQYSKLLGEKAQSDMDNQDLLGQIQRLAEEKPDLQSQIEILKLEIHLNGQWELSAKQLKQQNDGLKLQLQENRITFDQLQQIIDSLRNDIVNLHDQSDIRHEQHQDKIQTLKQVIKGQDIRQSETDSENRSQHKQLLLLKEKNASLQLGSQLTQEQLKSLEALKRNNTLLMSDNQQLIQTIDELTDSLQFTNNQILELRAEVLHQTQLQDEGESHNNNLKRLILEMRERGVAYIAMNNDQIDEKLAQFINNRQDSDRQRQLFVREGEGVYQFGSKKIYIKVEQDKILIRQGGGFISIEEFLNLYTQRESDGMMRGDPLAALSRNKAALRKRDEMKLVHSIKDEQVSPLKKKGIQHYDQ